MLKSVYPSNERSNGLLASFATLIGWVVTCALGILVIFDVRDIVLGLYLRLFATDIPTALLPAISAALVTWSMFLWAVVLVVYIFGSAEYAYRHFAQPQVLRLFAWALGVEILLIAVGWFF